MGKVGKIGNCCQGNVPHGNFVCSMIFVLCIASWLSFLRQMNPYTFVLPLCCQLWLSSLVWREALLMSFHTSEKPLCCRLCQQQSLFWGPANWLTPSIGAEVGGPAARFTPPTFASIISCVTLPAPFVVVAAVFAVGCMMLKHAGWVTHPASSAVYSLCIADDFIFYFLHELI